MRAASYSAESRLASCGGVFSGQLFMLFDSWQACGFALRATPVGRSLELTVADLDRMGVALSPVSVAEFFHVISEVVLHRSQFHELLREFGIAEMFELQAIGEPLMMPAGSVDGVTK
jgi:hypothetical protein